MRKEEVGPPPGRTGGGEKMANGARCENCPAAMEGPLAELSPSAIRRFSDCMTPHVFPARHRVFFQGNPCDRLGCIRKGFVKLTRRDGDGETPRTLGVARPGCLIGHEMFISRDYLHTSETVGPAEICMADREGLLRGIEKTPEMALGLMAFLSNWIVDLERSIEELGFQTAEQRLASFLLLVSSESAAAPLDFTRRDLADALCMAKETLSRLLVRFSRRRAIALEGQRISVVDAGLIRSFRGPGDRGGSKGRTVGKERKG